MARALRGLDSQCLLRSLKTEDLELLVTSEVSVFFAFTVIIVYVFAVALRQILDGEDLICHPSKNVVPGKLQMLRDQHEHVTSRSV